MFRNQYDTDVTVWSPQGRLHQVEYATEAVNQGYVCLGVRNENFVVLAALKRSPNDLAANQVIQQSRYISIWNNFHLHSLF